MRSLDNRFHRIEVLIATWQLTVGVTAEGATTLMRDARRMKQQSDISDEEAIARLVADVLSPGPVGADANTDS